MHERKSIKERGLCIGTKVQFHSGNFEGLTGVVTKIDWQSAHHNAIYGFYHTVELSDGRIGFIEKSEHFTVIS